MNKLYKATLLAALLLICGSLSAQIFSYDFEQCNVGDKVAETLGEPWTTWNQNPGSAEDALITDEQSLGTRSLKIDNGNDLVLKLGDKTTGAYNIAFDMYIPEGKEGYFNILHEFAGSNSVWAQEIFFNSALHGNYFSPGGAYDDFEVPYDNWFHIEIEIYLTNATACLKINGEIIIVWNYSQYTTTKYCSLAAMDFYPSSNSEARNGYFIDNISFTELAGPFIPIIVPENETIEVVMLKDEQQTVTTSITNVGNGICGYEAPWIDYGVGEEGAEKVLHYDTDPWYVFGNYDDNPYIEIGVVFPFDQLVESSFVGTKITKMQYYVTSYAIEGCDGSMKFSVFRRLSNHSTYYYTLLAEKEISDLSYDDWNTVEFDEPIPVSGFDVFATVGFQQTNGGYPISLDIGPAIHNEGDLVRLDGDSWFSLNENYIYYGGEDLGNHNIRLICEGLPVETQWISNVTPDSYLSTVFVPGQANTIEFAMNSSGLKYGEYTATYKMERSSWTDPEIAIPIKLKVSGTDVNEYCKNKHQIYPNPASDLVYMEGDNLRYAIIFNTLGEQIGIKKIEGNTINVNDLSNGVYQVCIMNSKGEKSVHRLVISK